MTPHTRTTRSHRLRAGMAGLCAVALAAVAAACGGPSGGGSAGGPSVDPGATKEEYIEALSDMDPVVIYSQLPGSPGTNTNLGLEKYAEAVEEWSGGKITFDITYGNAIADADTVDSALSDGRLGISTVNPTYDPARYPAFNAMGDLNFLGMETPVAGVLYANALYLESTWDTPEILEEAEDRGFRYLLPYGTIDGYGLACTNERVSAAQLNGGQGRAGSTMQAGQLEALGMSPVSLPYTEVYEALQRGVIDCHITPLSLAETVGANELTPYWIFDDVAGFIRPPHALAVGLPLWESLPLAAQQLLHDRLDVYIEERLWGLWDGNVRVAGGAIDDGGAISGFADDARAELEAFNDDALDEVRESSAFDGDDFVDRVLDAQDRWHQLVVEELEYSQVSYGDFGEWFEEGSVDLEPFIDLLREEILLPRRPS